MTWFRVEDHRADHQKGPASGPFLTRCHPSCHRRYRISPAAQALLHTEWESSL